jgi:MFS transporter, ACDE family, multidrug resistance protein
MALTALCYNWGFFTILGIAVWTLNKPVLIILVLVIASGIVCGVNNAVTTQAVMTVSPVERPVASAAYSFVRFIGGGLAPYVAGRLVADVNIHVPFYLGAGVIAAGIVILSTGHKLLGQAERVQAAAATAALHGSADEIAAEREHEAELKAEVLAGDAD